MKIHFDLPWGGVLEIDRTKKKQMDADDKFMLVFVIAVLCALLGIFLIASR